MEMTEENDAEDEATNIIADPAAIIEFQERGTLHIHVCAWTN